MAADELLLQLVRERADLFATVLEKAQEHELARERSYQPDLSEFVYVR